jgi:hypothetical protein
MKHSEKVTSVAAVLSAILSVTCCLPLSIPVAMGLAGFGMLMTASAMVHDAVTCPARCWASAAVSPEGV